MKPFKHFKAAKVAKKLALIGIASVLVAGCGKDNKVDKNDQFLAGNNPVFTSAQDQSYWNSLRTKYSCAAAPFASQGAQRLGDQNFTLQGGQSNANYIAGQLQPGFGGGSSGESYVGMNQGTHDLIYITKVSNGQTVTYNVIVSLCSWQGQFNYYIGGNAQLSNFQIPSNGPVQFQAAANCPTGLISGGWVTFDSSTYGGSVPTQFAATSCL